MESVSTGCDRLDGLLRGGIPHERSLMVGGPPGTGKTTLGMQFLQTGIDAGEDCLLVSTEQTLAELRDTFEPYPFDVDAPELTVVTINAAPGATLEDDHDLVVRTIDDGEPAVAEWFELPFTRENVVSYLEEFAPRDRVVLDSVSGLRPITDDRVGFWRSTYHLIRLFSDGFEATTVLTAQAGTDDTVASDLISYATHGVVDLTWDDVDGERHRFCRVAKLRGRDHDDRRYKLLLTDDGVKVSPGTRTQPAGLLGHDHLSTGMDGLDDLLGGGVVRGGLTTVTHDGTTGYYTVMTQVLGRALEAGMTLAVALPAEVTLDGLDRYWRDAEWNVDSLLDDDRLIVLELIDDGDRDHPNVLTNGDAGERDWGAVMRECYDRAGDGPLCAFVDTEPLLQTVSDERARAARYQAARSHTRDEDVVLYTINPRIQDDSLVAFLVDTSRQTLAFSRDDDGLEWVSLEKSPTGSPGSSRLVAYRDERPYVEFH